MHPIVNQSVDHDQVRARVDPPLPFRISPKEKGREGHREDLGSNPVRRPKRVQEGMAQAGGPIRCPRSISLSEAVINPGHEIARALVSEKEVERVRCSVQRALPQIMARQRTVGLVVRFGTGPAPFRVATPAERRIALQLGAGRVLVESGIDVGPSYERALDPPHLWASNIPQFCRRA